MTSEVIHIDSAELAIDNLRATLASRDERMAQGLHASLPIRIAVDHEMVSSGFVVRENSEIAFFPPVTGG
ncbi:MoaD/ThiS family protein [Paraburkholderia caribensis]|uniref:MoaD/ThiS family protein n=1 Tax=Paraburkholderia caribensis TaxID=75105 RepID=A0A9Q6S9R7_9BURK|nr:MoaD/ThiS family protein [Paraburkholderia caribensis]MCO4879270.1 MoaD/ThiS family protein [Paraburkholderia caribensis]PTB27433.1 molybdopterin converting factor subunit 1 [Paraburkholderia caribensis]QLB67063.1 molybdopterin synthase sulfur carrier subunit [Paraburkholderia caribensis]